MRKSTLLLSILLLFVLLFSSFGRAQTLPKELKGKWEGVIIVQNGNHFDTSKIILGIGNWNAKNDQQIEFHIKDFGERREVYFQFVEGVMFGEDNNGYIKMGFPYLAPVEHSGKTANGFYDFSLLKQKYPYLYGRFTPDNQSMDVIIDLVLFKKDDYKELSKAGNFQSAVSQILYRPAQKASTNQLVVTQTEDNIDRILPKISPNAIYIDVDEIEGINNNTILVRKGNKHAFMNLKGEIISPYNAYNNYDNSINLNRGFSYVTPSKHNINYSGQHQEYLTEKGEVIFKGTGPVFNNRIYYNVSDGKSVPTAIDRDNEPIPFISSCMKRNSSSEFNRNPPSEYIDIIDYKNMDGDCNTKLCELDLIPAVQKRKITLEEKAKKLGVPYSPDLKNVSILNEYVLKYGMVDRNGKTIIPFEYDAPLYFSDGMACVTKTDEFNETTFGFINTKGELIVPFKFSRRPGDFHEGLALVAPRENMGFDYAYIDKTGAIKLKIGDGSKVGITYTKQESYPVSNDGKAYVVDANVISAGFIYLPKNGHFYNGYALWKYKGKVAFLDKSGKFNSLQEIVNNDSYIRDDKGYFFKQKDEIGIYFEATSYLVSNENRLGMVDFSKNMLFPPTFSSLEIDHNGKLAYAVFRLPATPQKEFNYLKGIINSAGEFIILPKEESEW